jgi:protein SCO1/2/putative membrane protein
VSREQQAVQRRTAAQTARSEPQANGDRKRMDLPALNATLNASATVLLLWGRALVKRGRVEAHKRVMLAAFAVSSVFLASYVVHKVSRSFQSTTFNVAGAAKTAYLALLASHVALAALVPFLALALIRFGLRGELARHRRLARVAWPIWLYVSVTGVVIYALLYPLNPPPIR